MTPPPSPSPAPPPPDPALPDAPSPFETETMAELCARQGRVGEALAIYEHLLGQGGGTSTDRARWASRREQLAGAFAAQGGKLASLDDLALPDPPGVRAQASEGVALFAWALPETVEAPVLEVLLILRTGGGVETARRRLTLTDNVGRLSLPAPGLHSALAAVGTLTGGRFVPLARSPRA